MAFYGNSLHLGISSTIELALGIIAGCLATLRPLFKGAAQTARSFRAGSNISKNLPSLPSYPLYGDDSRSRSPASGSLFEVDKLWDNPQSASSTSTLLLAEKWRHGQLASPSSSNHRTQWDVEASPMSSPQWEQRSFGFLSPLPKAATRNGHRHDGRMPQVELGPMHGRRSSCPD
jgi:hypothetical protein